MSGGEKSVSAGGGGEEEEVWASKIAATFDGLT